MRANAIIAGVNKAGTTSLFVSLSGHREVATASIKETRYFLPPRWGRPLEPVSVYEHYFADAGDAPVRLEATPSYFYGGDAVVRAMQQVCGEDLRVLVVLREPVARFWSFFNYQKTRLRIDAQMTGDEYLAHADALDDADFRDPDNERWFGVRGGCYDEWLPVWHEAFGDRLTIVWFEELMADAPSVLARVATFLGIDPEGYGRTDLASENRTTAYRRAGLQRAALGFNDRFERFLRRHYGLKERLRSAYYRVNGASRRDRMPPSLAETLRSRYAEANQRLAAELDREQRPRPPWLANTTAKAVRPGS
jgi:hypothetical protein